MTEPRFKHGDFGLTFVIAMHVTSPMPVIFFKFYETE